MRPVAYRRGVRMLRGQGGSLPHPYTPFLQGRAIATSKSSTGTVHLLRPEHRVVFHRGHDAAASSTVAFQPVRHPLQRRALLPLEQLAKEPLGRVGVAVSLNQDVDHIPILVDGPSQIVPLTPDPNEDLVRVPDIAEWTLTTFELASVTRSDLSTPLPDGLIGDDDATLREQILHVTEAQGEPMVQPHAVADDLTGESIGGRAVRLGFHHTRVPTSGAS